VKALSSVIKLSPLPPLLPPPSPHSACSWSPQGPLLAVNTLFKHSLTHREWHSHNMLPPTPPPLSCRFPTLRAAGTPLSCVAPSTPTASPYGLRPSWRHLSLSTRSTVLCWPTGVLRAWLSWLAHANTSWAVSGGYVPYSIASKPFRALYSACTGHAAAEYSSSILQLHLMQYSKSVRLTERWHTAATTLWSRGHTACHTV